MTRKKHLVRSAALLAVGGLSVVGLAACSSGTTDSSSSEGASDGSPVTIEYMHRLPDGDGMTKVADIVAKWNEEHPDVQVKTTKYDGKATDMQVKLEADVKAGTAPCLAQVGYSEIPNLYVKGMLADVTTEAEKYAKNFSAGAYSGMSVGDVTVGLPQDVGPLVYFYNEAAFTQLGLTVPTTLDELAAESATAAAAGKYITAFQPDEAQYWLSAQSAAAGDTWFSTEGDKWKVDAEGAGSQKVAAFWQNLLDNKQTLATERWGEGFTAALNDGSLIGHVGAAWEAGFLLDGISSTGSWKVAQLPDYGQGALTGPDGGSGVAVLKGCEHPAEAMEFNDWFNTQVDDLATQGLVVAATTSVPETPANMATAFGGQDVMTELSTAAASMNPDFPYAPGFSSVSTLSQTAADVVSGSKKVTDIFTEAQNASVKALKDLGLPVAE